MSHFSVGQELEVTLGPLSFGGSSIARVDGFVIFVPLGAPGDLAKIRITNVKKNFAEAQLTSLVNPSPLRREPRCEYFGKCGGCDWQHVTYEEQLRAKHAFVAREVINLGVDDCHIYPIIASPAEFHYRNRIQLYNLDGILGYRKRKSHDLISISHCEIADERISNKIKHISKPLNGRVDIRLDDTGEAVVTLTSETKELSFSQVNKWQNQKLTEIVSNWASEFKFENILDLYAGSGNLSLPILDQNPKALLTAVESNAESVRRGQRLTKSKSVHFVRQDVEPYIFNLKFLAEKTLVLLDPPRAGAGVRVMQHLSELKPDAIVYVSCDPMTWARDASALLSANNGLELKRIQPLDMFPQTSHVELISLFARDARRSF